MNLFERESRERENDERVCWLHKAECKPNIADEISDAERERLDGGCFGWMGKIYDDDFFIVQ